MKFSSHVVKLYQSLSRQFAVLQHRTFCNNDRPEVDGHAERKRGNRAEDT